MDILDKYYVFCTLDEGLIEPSYVFFRTLLKHNPYIKLHVHCINFSEDKLNSILITSIRTGKITSKLYLSKYISELIYLKN